MKRNLFLACVLGVLLECSLLSGASMGTAFTYQGRLSSKGDPAEGLYAFDFKLFDALKGGDQVGKTVQCKAVEIIRGTFTVSVDFGADVFNGSPRWLEIAVGPYSQLPIKKTTLSPRQPITAVPYAIRAAHLSGTIDISQITGFLGQGYTLLFPDVLYNRALVEMDTITYGDPVVIQAGPGVDIDRIKGFDGLGRYDDHPGFAQEHPFIFEADGLHAEALKDYFDAFLANPKQHPVYSFSLIVFNLGGMERFRWNFAEFAPQDYEPGLDNRTRFTLSVRGAPDHTLQWSMAGPDFGGGLSYNPNTDRLIEIDAINNVLYAQVAVNETERTLTFTYNSKNGRGIQDWIESVVGGTEDRRSLSVIELDENMQEIGRENYHGCFPIRYDIVDGFGLDTTLRARIVLSYNASQPG
ncbi:MAG: hypothetical protein JXA82_17235 [Sedimentisphaerales bacterium]|nr:hypothetical protein [Sedimentisphaerales bacterium]